MILIHQQIGNVLMIIIHQQIGNVLMIIMHQQIENVVLMIIMHQQIGKIKCEMKKKIQWKTLKYNFLVEKKQYK